MEAPDLLTLGNRRIFNNDSFRGDQLRICQTVLDDKEVFVVQHTGFGKSLTYQLPAVVSRGVTVVISPLVSLMHDQVQALKAKNISALQYTSDMSDADRFCAIDVIRRSRIQLLYVAPEALMGEGHLQKALAELWHNSLLRRFVVDEAHCCSEFGHDFRPAYSRLGELKDTFPGVLFTAITGTATERTKTDIKKILRMKNPVEFFGTSRRANLILNVEEKFWGEETVNEIVVDSCWKQILAFVLDQPTTSTGIIYCMTKKDTEKLANWLSQQKQGGDSIKAAHYHGELNTAQRSQVYNAWMRGETRIVVATTAFGMGVDKGDVRWIVHHSMPQSMEAYVQEVGRAGRDGAIAKCLMLFSAKTVQVIRKNFQKDLVTKEARRRKLVEIEQFSQNVKQICRHRLLMEHFAEEGDTKLCNSMCDACCESRSSAPQKSTRPRRASAGIAGKRAASSPPRADARRRRKSAPA